MCCCSNNCARRRCGDENQPPTPHTSRSVMECGSPLPLFPDLQRRVELHRCHRKRQRTGALQDLAEFPTPFALMDFLAPTAFAFLATLPVVILFYLLKRKRVVKLVAS